jgi:1-deoxy-D-xylulose-5-phosphate synthase
MTIEAEPLSIPKDLQNCTIAQLEDLAAQIRRFLLENISRTGGHIGANLGTVELTIALHRVFRSPDEPLLFDTGHQGYTHKLLTGRANMFPSLNSYGGMNRFLTPHESSHDPIEASHAGTAISIGLGISLARKLRGDQSPVVALVGDSALAEGSSLEALNHAVVEDTKLVLVINDNGYAISPGFGGLHELLSSGSQRAKPFFESLGMRYLGPVDGHDIGALVDILKKAREPGRMPVVHAKTIKGQGWAPADLHPFRMHFSFPFDPETGASRSGVVPACTYVDVVGTEIERAMEKDERIVCITPSTLYATGLGGPFRRFPTRCFDPGMEEQHALSMTVGLALVGYIPVIAYQSTFLQRAFDQLLHDVCFSNRPTLILSMRSGFSGYDNSTHHGLYDIAYLRPLPNLTILYPKDGGELAAMIQLSLSDLRGPVMIMMPYGPLDDFGGPGETDPREPELVFEGKDTLILTVGNKFGAAKEAANRLGAGLVNIRQLKPLPEQRLLQLIAPYQHLVTIEEAVLDGGMGSALAALLTDYDKKKELLRIGLPCDFIEPGSNDELCQKYDLDAKGLYSRIVERWPNLIAKLDETS